MFSTSMNLRVISLDLSSPLYMLRDWLRNRCKHYHLTVRHVLGMCDVRSVCVFDLALKLVLIEHHKIYTFTHVLYPIFVISIIAYTWSTQNKIEINRTKLNELWIATLYTIIHLNVQYLSQAVSRGNIYVQNNLLTRIML